MEIFQFDRGEKIIRNFGSKGLLATRIAAGNGRVRLTCLTLEPGVSSACIRRQRRNFSW